MARMIPQNVKQFTTEGERQTYQFLEAVAKPDNLFLCWYLPDVQGREPDFLLFSKSVGLVVLEVKDWNLEQIREATPHEFFIDIGGKTEPRSNPLKQARDYISAMLDKVKADGRLVSKDPLHHGNPKIPIDCGVVLTAIQQRIRECVKESGEFIDPALYDTLTDVRFPVHFLDSETIMPAIPRYEGTRPYQTIPFQWSDHILYTDGKLEQREFLFNEDIDPRTDFTQSLLDVLGREGTIFIYTTYEQRILKELAEQFPKYAGDLNQLHSRFFDLCALIKSDYYHPAFHGSFSIKPVLPSLVPKMDYQKLVIQEGGMASLEYLRMIDPITPAAEKQEIRKNLLA